ncbi:short chain dehydrogenase family protein [Cercophora newfieldiana]|uniref:Short chain dehydrogenase family protein n=1 Tax=Cercophora newfieldiana TaxID=92897 RepID=A0AA40CR58_9PEZI|nr:short chain dehydrogenase family protein [Cercophora newfieldiana]
MTPPSPKPVAVVIGASRGIGRQVAIDLAAAGYAVVVAAKSSGGGDSSSPFPPDPNSPSSTITTVEREIRSAGGEATAIPVDTTDPPSIQRLISTTIEKYHHLDTLIYNPGAIWWAAVSDTPLKRYQLMHRVNTEGLYSTIQAALPHLTQSKLGGRIIVVSPPIYSRFFRGKTAYAMTKVAMSVLTKGLAMDFERQGRKDMAITSIWPAVSIESAATQQFTRKDPSFARDLRTPRIFSDAILAMLKAPAEVVNGQLLLDEDFLREYSGVTDFSKYAVVPGSEPRRIMPVELPDLRVKEQDDEGMRHDSAKERSAKL